jgi:hypothetical protein
MELKWTECHERAAKKISDKMFEKCSEELTFPWVIKNFENKSAKEGTEDGAASVRLTALYKGGIRFSTSAHNIGEKVLRDCFEVHYCFNGQGTYQYFDNLVEAIDLTMKLIALAKA